MKGKDRFLSYTAYATILVCPAAYAKEHPAEAAHFDAVISIECLSSHIDPGTMAQ